MNQSKYVANSRCLKYLLLTTIFYYETVFKLSRLGAQLRQDETTTSRQKPDKTEAHRDRDEIKLQ